MIINPMEQVNDLILKIRSATSPLHKQLETSALSQKIVSPHLTKDDYITYLKTMLVLHAQTEADVFPVVKSMLPDLNARIKSTHIRADLAELTSENHENTIFFDEYYQNNLPFNMGLMYVTEGSTLGGLYILKNVQSVFGEKMSAHSFFNVYGEKTGSFWKAYLNQLNVYAATISEADKELVISGAVYGFKKTKELFFGAPVLL